MVPGATLSSGLIVGQTGSFATNWNTSPTSALVVLAAQHQVLVTIRRKPFVVQRGNLATRWILTGGEDHSGS